MYTVRESAVSGLFYPDNPQQLKSYFSNWLPGRLPGVRAAASLPRALIVPHAGYAYSGAAAAKGYQLWQGAEDRIKTVVVMGPAHRVAFEGIATVSADELETPLGSLKVDVGIRDAILSEFAQVGVSDYANAPEHSLEVHFPFIKEILPDAKVLPLLNGHVATLQVVEVLERLWQDESVFFVISSDLSHFHTYDEAQQIDHQTADIINRRDSQSLNGERACGYKGIQGLLGMMAHAENPDTFEIEQLELVNSGDTAGSIESVVGYGTWAIYQKQ